MYCHRFTSDFNTGWKWSWHAWPIIAARARPAAAIGMAAQKRFLRLVLRLSHVHQCGWQRGAKMTVKSCGSHFVMIFTLCSREACRRCRAALQHLEHSVCAPYMRWSVQIAPTDQRHWSVGAIPTDQNSLVGRDRPALVVQGSRCRHRSNAVQAHHTSLDAYPHDLLAHRKEIHHAMNFANLFALLNAPADCGGR